MLAERDKYIILKIAKHCKRIQKKTTNNYDEFMGNDDLKEIVCFNLFQIGELVKNLSQNFINVYNDVPWKHIKGMRDRIVHGYGTIDFEIVWNTIRKDIPNLYKYCILVLKKISKQ